MVEENDSIVSALATRQVVLPSGRAIEVESKGDVDVLRIRSEGGACVLTIHLTDAGPVVRVEAASLEVSAAKRLSFDCEELHLRASGSATIDVGGDLHERVGGSAMRTAQHMRMDAQPGGIELRANDDVKVTGERVLLNSDDQPMPLTWEEYEARRMEREGKALGPAVVVKGEE